MPHTVGLAAQEETAQEETANVVTVKTRRDIPWGFDERSYEMYMDGRLDPYIPSGSELEQCAAADLDLDGIEDLLLSLTIPETGDLYGGYSYPLNTVILRGRGDNTYELAAENSDFNFSSYDGSALLSAFYYNQYGYTKQGISEYQSPENFGEISFREFEGDLDWDTKAAEKDKRDEELCVDTNGFQVTVSGAASSGAIDKYFTMMIDIDSVRRISLSDVIDTEKLYDIILEKGFAEKLWPDSSTAEMNFTAMSREECLALLRSSDKP